ncbi:ATP phosphoribosyltransferase regulatory subunit [Parasporobacterium paucivorans]|uniref:ATP phosphoribosyltransferase regulatory subunit n=1 Tax=Parasporobacterium paucivorans DSM 15970 TaxID=1122934 RepID=A0A1M6A757_9FIRM|nr:ATP phosphoribosyltransferase regulatory subunit [Parasporobacterium paucivorans]SHI31973.1 ATP phosphoribosyltransferase regulatory subunit [Parasporobacterium paucivorans DSM 15970]
MERKLFHTPEGVRDIYGKECAGKLAVQQNIHEILSRYGYHDIQTPTFEFFDIFNKEMGSVPSKDQYKFFDREGNTLVLRPDITPSIARCAAKYYSEEELPLRLCYMGNTFINNSGFQGKLKEFTQIGCELINDNSSDADAEIIAMVIEALLKAGLTEFQVEVGQVDFFRGLVEEAGLEEEVEEYLRELIERKNYFGVEQLLSTQNIDEDLKNVFLKLPELFGGTEIIEIAGSLAKNPKTQKAVKSLERLYEILGIYGLQKYVSFDLGMLSKYKYYTGIIFMAYTYGTGDTIVTGGRYDNLLKRFGKTAPSVGFAINVDQLMIALGRQKIEIPFQYSNTMILYRSGQRETAIQLAGRLRLTGQRIELIKKSRVREIEDYIRLADSLNTAHILYLDDPHLVKSIQVQSREETLVPMTELLTGKEAAK